MNFKFPIRHQIIGYTSHLKYPSLVPIQYTYIFKSYTENKLKYSCLIKGDSRRSRPIALVWLMMCLLSVHIQYIRTCTVVCIHACEYIHVLYKQHEVGQSRPTVRYEAVSACERPSVPTRPVKLMHFKCAVSFAKRVKINNKTSFKWINQELGRLFPSNSNGTLLRQALHTKHITIKLLTRRSVTTAPDYFTKEDA